MIKVSRVEREQKEIDDLVSIDDVLKIIDSNRTRVRTLGGIVLTVCGLLLSTSFVILFFILKNNEFHISPLVPILLLITSASLTCAIVCSVLSALLPMPVTIISKIELVDFWTKTYRREYRRVILAVCFLLLSIILFVIALSTFSSGLMN